jgi:exodeoxyribonuclease V beta subunit
METSVDDIDLDRHAVVEAAAGTGKTYTLEHLVRRLLLANKANLDQILLVTYTEKATGELKGRLRKNLEQAVVDHPENKDRFQQAIDQFDQAHITTIHGFCQQMLQEYAFEQGQDFQPKLVEDGSLLPTCLREVQRKCWPREYGRHLRAILDLAGYEGKNRGRWENRALDIGGKFRPACGHRLLPGSCAGWHEQMPALEARLADGLQRVRRAAGSFPLQYSKHPWITGYDKLSQARNHAPRKERLLGLVQVLAQTQNLNQPLAVFLRLQEELGGEPFTSLHDKLAKKVQLEFDVYCPHLREALTALETMRLEMERLAPDSQLLINAVGRMQDQLAEIKRERGLRSYEDMLVLMDQGLDPARNAGAHRLVEKLRDRFRYAIVDEFQDTDPLQWRIFQRIFVDGGACRLFVVGDPKQAIFAFRGADLPTYLHAVRDLAQEHAATIYPLTTNWRSCPELLQALNHLFEKGNWFQGDGIDYRPVSPPEEKDQPNKLVGNESGLAALSMVDLTGSARMRDARRHHARFIAGEIRRLLGNGGESSMKMHLKGEPEPRFLNAGDIAILIFKHNEAQPVIKALRKAGIAYSYYKQRGLWRSEEALHLGYLLRALARPEHYPDFHKALLTRFFGLTPLDLMAGAELPPRHPARRLFLKWIDLAQERAWASLFRSFIEDTGVLFDRAGSERNDGDADRRLANYHHILHTLEQAAYEQNLDLDGIIDILEGQRRLADDQDFQPIETERPKVHIMTVHASKGLEFPVVFLAGGFTDKVNQEYLTYHEGNHVVFDLVPDDQAKEKAKRERTAEQRRLLYVALTRAMFKLIVPMVNKGKSSGPAATLLTPALKKARLEDLGQPCVSILHPQIGRSSGSQQEQSAVTERAAPADCHCLVPTEWFPRLDADLYRRGIHIRSFSSLHRQSQPRPEEASYIERPPRKDDDITDSLAIPDPLRGPVFGDMVHAVLETLDFASIGQAPEPAALIRGNTPFRKSVDKQLARNLMKLQTRVSGPQIEDACRQQIAHLVWNTLRTPLPEVGPLWQIPPHDRLHEVEFHFPEELGPAPPEVRAREGFLTGFMDLVFRKHGRIYLVDWKTNLLESYAAEDIRQAMDECDYVRQYRLYLQALSRWLGSRGGFDFNCDFGGVFYLFLRGMSGQDDSSGVFFHKPTAEDLRLDLVLGGA